MKKLLILLVYCLFIGQSFGQSNGKSNDIIGQSFVTKTSISVKAYDPTIKEVIDLSFLLNDGIKFYIYDVVEKGYVLSVWNYSTNLEKEYFYKNLPNSNENKIYEPFNKEKPNYYKILKPDVGIKSKEITKDSLNASKYKYKDLAYIDSWANNSHFFISLKDFNDKCESIYPHKRGFTWGFLTLPIKARFGNSKAPFTFEEKINFGISAGVKWQHVNTVYSASNLLGGVSVGGVKIDKDNSASAISLSGGYMYQYDKFQIGIFTGVDFIDKSAGVSWGYQGKPWVGFAIGFSLFGEGKTTVAGEQTQK
ncbi:hypothetical protein EV200_103330 [Pedobacter psychrotolerans]|uniref:Outer membrane protein with beta-barrel domain n=2 Tax=Pedobacter psychrotolerans TaxID=1843235 RepID=A0A4R2HG09_9SPHI|nr:hypothetical protein EV200_103330 [Pedobacter psychrotolerans]GGE58137.1 hypothetical protein GCM10011413_25710 [Pedobacter psychrotolerans]